MTNAFNIGREIARNKGDPESVHRDAGGEGTSRSELLEQLREVFNRMFQANEQGLQGRILEKAEENISDYNFQDVTADDIENLAFESELLVRHGFYTWYLEKLGYIDIEEKEMRKLRNEEEVVFKAELVEAHTAAYKQEN